MSTTTPASLPGPQNTRKLRLVLLLLLLLVGVTLINPVTASPLAANNIPTEAADISPLPEPDQLVAAGQETLVQPQQVPRSDRTSVLQMYRRFFVKPRSHDDQTQKELVRDGVVLRLLELGFQTSFLQKSRFDFRHKAAFCYNMISILPGPHWRTSHDKILLVGAHWDSYTKAPGVDDNGSGSTCLLEIARLVSANRCTFNHTVMLVWFDYEEQGKFGSEFFVNDYLFPHELDKYGSQFVGAYILDMILVRDRDNNTQMLPDSLKVKVPEFAQELELERHRGDFLATWARRRHDEPLEKAFASAWTGLGFAPRTFKAMRPDLPQKRLPNGDERHQWRDFFRSDHASFWYPQLTSNAVRRSPDRLTTTTSSSPPSPSTPSATSTSTSTTPSTPASTGHNIQVVGGSGGLAPLKAHPSLNAILLTDLGPWRKSYQPCYHGVCDDEHLLTEGNLAFMQQVIDSLLFTLMRVGQGRCQTTSNSTETPLSSSHHSPTATQTTTTTTTTLATTAT